LLPSGRPNSNFLVLSESFYIKRYKNKGYRYHLDREDKQLLSTNTSESKAERKKRYNNLMKRNNWTKAKLANHLGVSRVWITKVLKN